MKIKNSNIIQSVRFGAWPEGNYDVKPGYGTTIEFTLKPFDTAYRDIINATALDFIGQIMIFCYGSWDPKWVFGPIENKLTLNCDTVRDELRKRVPRVKVSISEIYMFILLLAHFSGWKVYGLNANGIIVPDRRIGTKDNTLDMLSAEERLIGVIFRKKEMQGNTVSAATEDWFKSQDISTGVHRHLHDLIYGGCTWEVLSGVSGFTEEIRADLERYLKELGVDLGMQPVTLKKLELGKSLKYG